jgi:hypothetical protein
MADGIPQGWKQVTDPNQLNQDMTERPVPGLYKATVPGIKDDNGRSTPLPVVTNSSNGNFQVYEPTLFGDKLIYSYNASNDKTTINDKEKYKTYFSGEEGKKQYDTLNKTVKTRTLEISEKNAKGDGGGVSPQVAKKQLEDLKKSEGYKSTTSTPQPEDPNKPAEGTATANQVQQLVADAGKYQGRDKYPPNLKYPILRNDNQDCMKFTIIEYVPSKLGIGAQDTTLRTSASKNDKQKILTTITLPMPSGGITDRNSVSWQDDSLNPAEAGFGAAALALIAGGADAGANSFKSQLEAATKDKGTTTALIAIQASQKAVGANNLLGRVAGLAINSNLELLFNGPQLRDFSFSFKMTPRSKKEAQMVRSIIRTFKQAMSVKRSKSVLLLKAPHTFRISYLTSNKDHPYLNRFKECALTNCSVNYAPDNSYMSYDDSDPDGRSMTAYELSLNFYELEPIFDDDYETMEGAKGSFNHIGY